MKRIIFSLFLLKISLTEVLIKSWNERIQLIQQTPIYQHEITIFNSGDDNFHTFQLALLKSQVDLIANIGAEDEYGNILKLSISEEVSTLTVNEEDEEEFQMVRIELHQPLGSEQEVTIMMPYVLYGHYEFLPDKIDLFEDQKVVYHAQLYPTVPYEIKELNVEVAYGDSRQRYTKTFDNIPSNSFLTKRFHFPLNRHFLQMRSSSRYIEVSHWGNIKFSETYDMVNRGANLVGHFSNIDFSERNQDAGRNAFRFSDIELPYEAWGFSYRDELGNISTSIARRDDNKMKALVRLTPRYALQGGWNSTWELGYNLPAEEYLLQNPEGTDFIFEYPLAHTVTEGISDEFTLTIALPEGAEITEVDAGALKPFHQEFTKTFGYLDFIGRPSVVMKFKNHVPAIVSTKVKIRYKFSKTKLMIEPLYLVSGLFTLFMVSITVGRLHLDFKET